MILLFILHLTFVIINTIVRPKHVLERVDVGVVDFQFFKSLILDRSEAKLSHDATILGLNEQFSHIHSELSSDLFSSVWVYVHSSKFRVCINYAE